MPLPKGLSVLPVCAIAAAAVWGACAGDDASPAAARDASVAAEGFAFRPAQVTIERGGTVTWRNGDDFEHSIVVEAVELDGPKFGPQQTFRHRFGAAGTYAYFCGVHNSMTGEVVVNT